MVALIYAFVSGFGQQQQIGEDGQLDGAGSDLQVDRRRNMDSPSRHQPAQSKITLH